MIIHAHIAVLHSTRYGCPGALSLLYHYVHSVRLKKSAGVEKVRPLTRLMDRRARLDMRGGLVPKFHWGALVDSTPSMEVRVEERPKEVLPTPHFWSTVAAPARGGVAYVVLECG